MVFLFLFITLFKNVSRKWREYFYNLFLKIKYFLFMNLLEDVHEHTWIIKNFKYFLYMNFCKDYRECHGGISYPDCGRKIVGFFYSGVISL
jgi:hypothetical protein